jgi:hypothetical protein
VKKCVGWDVKKYKVLIGLRTLRTRHGNLSRVKSLAKQAFSGTQEFPKGTDDSS